MAAYITFMHQLFQLIQRHQPCSIIADLNVDMLQTNDALGGVLLASSFKMPLGACLVGES